MRVAHDDLILSTQGRSFWIMDDISPLREIEAAVAAGAYLFQPRDARRLTNLGSPGLAELNPEPGPAGAQIHYYLAEELDDEVQIEVVDPRGEVVRTFSSDSAAAEEADGEKISGTAGLNRIAWTLHYAGPELPEGAVVWGYSDGVKAPPGTYTVRMSVGETMAERAFELLPDPRIPEVTAASYADQFRVAVLARDSINSITRAIEDLASIRAQVEEVMAARQEMAEWYSAFSLDELRVHLATIRLAPGAREGLSLLRGHGFKICIVSLTWSFAVEWFANMLGADYSVGTGLSPDGRIDPFWPQDKAAWLTGLARKLDIDSREVVAVGDSNGDIPMLLSVGHPYWVGQTVPHELDGKVIHEFGGDIRLLAEHAVHVTAKT